jgi:hypothetical protein
MISILEQWKSLKDQAFPMSKEQEDQTDESILHL